MVGVMAFDSPSHGPSRSGYTRVIVRVLDANDHPPSLSIHSLRSRPGHRLQRFSVPENAPVGSFVAHLSVSDRDSGPNAFVSCQLTRGADLFQLIRLTGISEYKLVSSRVFDREQQEMHTIVIMCLVCVLFFICKWLVNQVFKHCTCISSASVPGGYTCTLFRSFVKNNFCLSWSRG